MVRIMYVFKKIGRLTHFYLFNSPKSHFHLLCFTAAVLLSESEGFLFHYTSKYKYIHILFYIQAGPCIVN